ncbi:hypothetical protein HPB52_024006 [Rhipicephalus sanguineus]|uniref:Uncharacterized protein n=1 Tax=Rhipicephalus sanguineus TaxID=34632 RepID=A0A9D4SWZ0_RHISA|nr:hypothetical protein HPB52_024006 [Rhipicephalus sanguineus]
MSSITVFEDPPEPLTIPEPRHILSSTLKKPAPEPPIMAADSPPIPPPGPSDARHLQSGESVNEAQVSAKVIIKDRSQEPKATDGSHDAYGEHLKAHPSNVLEAQRHRNLNRHLGDLLKVLKK